MKTPRAALLIVLLTSVVIRGSMWLIYDPAAPPDTLGYVTVAHQIASGDFSEYDGSRTPGYPAFLLAGGLDYRVIWLLQSMLGTAIAGLLFVVVYARTHSVGWAAAAGLVQAVNLNQVFFERVMVSETLATFLLLVSIAITVTLRGERRGHPPAYFFLGVAVAAAAMTRPLFVAMIPLYLAYFLFCWSGVSWTARLRCSGAYLAPVLVAVLGWSAVNYATVGYFGPTTMTGFNLTNHSGGFIEHAADRYQPIRDIYLKFRAERVAETGSFHMTIWDAYPEIRQATGLSFPALSRELTAMTVDLVVRYPQLYLRSVGQSLMAFWVPATYDWSQGSSAPAISAALRSIWRLERFPVLALSVLFVLACGHVLLRQPFASWKYDILPIAIVLTGWIVQALMEQGENHRYAIPFEPLVTYTAIAFAWGCWRELRVSAPETLSRLSWRDRQRSSQI